MDVPPRFLKGFRVMIDEPVSLDFGQPGRDAHHSIEESFRGQS
jgi:hypothetical protein